MDKYVRTATELVVLLGGAENVDDLAHCITRLRITLIDRQALDDPGLREHPAILGRLDSNASVHLIVGPAVATPLADALAAQIALNTRRKR